MNSINVRFCYGGLKSNMLDQAERLTSSSNAIKYQHKLLPQIKLEMPVQPAIGYEGPAPPATGAAICLQVVRIHAVGMNHRGRSFSSMKRTPLSKVRQEAASSKQATEFPYIKRPLSINTSYCSHICASKHTFCVSKSHIASVPL